MHGNDLRPKIGHALFPHLMLLFVDKRNFILHSNAWKKTSVGKSKSLDLPLEYVTLHELISRYSADEKLQIRPDHSLGNQFQSHFSVLFYITSFQTSD